MLILNYIFTIYHFISYFDQLTNKTDTQSSLKNMKIKKQKSRLQQNNILEKENYKMAINKYEFILKK